MFLHLLADHGAQTIGDALAIRHQLRLLPPALAVEPQELSEDHEHAQEHDAAHQAEDEAEQSIRAAEERQPHEVLSSHAMPMPSSITRTKMMVRAAHVLTGGFDKSPPRCVS